MSLPVFRRGPNTPNCLLLNAPDPQLLRVCLWHNCLYLYFLYFPGLNSPYTPVCMFCYAPSKPAFAYWHNIPLCTCLICPLTWLVLHVSYCTCMITTILTQFPLHVSYYLGTTALDWSYSIPLVTRTHPRVEVSLISLAQLPLHGSNIPGTTTPTWL
jgi:hypothetical protein